MREITIGLLGCGTVGRGFVELLSRERQRIASRDGIDLRLARILVRDDRKPRAGIDQRLLTTNAVEVIDGSDIVVELVGGVHSAGAFVRRALARKCDVVTANKALLAASGRELFALAACHDVRIAFEASVCGGIPIIRALQRGLAGDSIESVSGILNGTCNYILTRMEADGLNFADALYRAQEAGFAEADPTLDISGEDAAQKLRILADLAFPAESTIVRARVHGIGDVTREEIEQARSRRCVIRQIATARRAHGWIDLRVERRELPDSHPFAAVRDENNAVVLRGRAVGEILFAGRGAGSLPTAAAVLADVIDLAREPRASLAKNLT